MTDGLEAALLLAGRRNSLRVVRIKITAVSPLTVQLPDGSTVPGLAVTGLTYTATGNGVALIAEGIVPLVFPTA